MLNWIQKNRHIAAGICFMLAAVLLLVMFLPAGGNGPATNPTDGTPGGTDTQPTELTGIALSEFTIVTTEEDMELANALAVDLKIAHDVALKVVTADAFQGGNAIYLNTTGFNSYGGYKYSVSFEETEDGASFYLEGSGLSLATAVAKWKDAIQNPNAFPFGLEDSIKGYEWNTTDASQTALGYTLQDSVIRELANGVEIRELKYKSFAFGELEAYAVILKAGSEASFKVVNSGWDVNTEYSEANPAPKYTVETYAQQLTDEGYQVLAITNGGFYDLNTGKTNLPWGMQIVDGTVWKAPNTERSNYSDNWFGLTKDGEYVISNTEGYLSTYEGKIQQGLGGGQVLMRDGVPVLSGTTPDYRTAIAYTQNGDMVLLTVDKANYATIAQIMMDLDIDVEMILNLDGGGSTTLHTRDENGELKQFMCETGSAEREVADAVAIVIKK